MKNFLIAMLLIASTSAFAQSDPISLRKLCSANFVGETLRACFQATDEEVIRLCAANFVKEDLRSCFRAQDTEIVRFCAAYYTGADLRACFGDPNY